MSLFGKRLSQKRKSPESLEKKKELKRPICCKSLLPPMERHGNILQEELPLYRIVRPPEDDTTEEPRPQNSCQEGSEEQVSDSEQLNINSCWPVEKEYINLREKLKEEKEGGQLSSLGGKRKTKRKRKKRKYKKKKTKRRYKKKRTKKKSRRR